MHISLDWHIPMDLRLKQCVVHEAQLAEDDELEVAAGLLNVVN